MKRTQIYLSADQHDFLENLAFLKSKEEHKRVSISAIIRNAITLFKENYIKNKSENNDLEKMRIYASSSLENIWNNKQDDEYDKL